MVLGLGTSTSVGLFGKAPTHADFIRFNAGSPAARAWDEWINASLTELRRASGATWETVFDAAPSLHFAVRPTAEARLLLAGHIQPCRDQSGRRYPLTIFAEIPLDRQGRGIQVLPFALSPFLDAATQVTQACWTRTPDSEVIKAMGSLVPENPVELTRSMADHLREVTMESFWSSLFGSFDDHRKYLCIKNLFGILAPLRGYDPQRLSMGLRLPGAGSGAALSPSTVMTVWASLSRAIAGEECLTSSWLFWHHPAEAQRGGCFIFFHTASHAALTAMLNADQKSESIWDVEAIGTDKCDEARDSLGPAITTVLESPKFSVLEFIQRI